MRTPTSAPLARTIGFTRSAAVTPSAGSTVIVVPRASFSWKPRPALTKNSVSAHGPNTNESFGLVMLSLAEPLFASRSLSTSKFALSYRRPAITRSQSVACTCCSTKKPEPEALHGVLADGRAALAIFGEIEAHLADVVEAGFDARREILPGRLPMLFVAADFGVQAVSLAVVELLELVAVRSVDGVGEVGEQVEAGSRARTHWPRSPIRPAALRSRSSVRSDATRHRRWGRR